MNTSTFFIISGTSGSGKTIALQVLEDLGFYCVDNLPASLLPEMATRAVLAEEKQSASTNNFAVSIDSRNQDFIGDLKNDFGSLRSSSIDYRVIFLDADDRTLLKRYSETRRKHPLSDENTSLLEAISKERQILEPIADIADLRINTADKTPHELRSHIRNYAASNDEAAMTLLFQSFGFKYGSPADTDFVFDVRCLPNPYWNSALKTLTGQDAKVIEYLDSQAECNDMYQHIRDFIAHWLPSFIADNRNYMTVAIGCTGGQHRSVYLADLMQQFFAKNDSIHTQVRHRELDL